MVSLLHSAVPIPTVGFLDVFLVIVVGVVVLLLVMLAKQLKAMFTDL